MAVLEDDDALHHVEEPMAKGQAERLMPLVEQALKAADTQLSDLDAIAVGIGPGNFTGIRLSVAAARGLALSLKIPAIGVSSLEAAAEGQSKHVIAVLDARRGAAYAQHFDWDGPNDPFRAEDASKLDTSLPWVGELEGAIQPLFPRAIAIGRVAARKLGQANLRPAPLYLRPADAAPPREGPPKILA